MQSPRRRTRYLCPFAPKKCASLSMSKQAPRIQPDQFIEQNNPIPMINREDHYLYLGVPIGLVLNVTNFSTIIDELTTKLTKIENSLLAPWQKLDAIRTFIQRCLTYALRSTDPTTKSLHAYRAQLIRTIPAICSLPTRATTHYIFAASRVGGLGLTDPLTDNNFQTVVQAMKMLSSTDPAVAAVAKRELRQTVRFTTQSDPTPALISNFLSNAPDRRLENIRSRTASLCTRTRRATKTLQLTISVPDDGAFSLTTPTYEEPVADQISSSKPLNTCL